MKDITINTKSFVPVNRFPTFSIENGHIDMIVDNNSKVTACLKVSVLSDGLLKPILRNETAKMIANIANGLERKYPETKFDVRKQDEVNLYIIPLNAKSEIVIWHYPDTVTAGMFDEQPDDTFPEWWR
jgi:hypothetical protein